MLSALVAFVLAMATTASLTPLVRRAALAAGAVDEPGARRVHTRRVPRMGGLAIVCGFFFPLLVLWALQTHSVPALAYRPRAVVAMAVAAVLVALVGLRDDIRPVGAKRKLAVQALAATIAYAAGVRIDAISLPGIAELSLGWVAFPATLAWIIGIVNAMNLIDGLDGLAAGVAFFACLTNFVIGHLAGNVGIELVTASLGGSLIGFLFYNFNPARIFMGDSGSMFLGFVLATASLFGAGTQKSPTLIAIVVPVLALGLPIMDMLLAIARRFVSRRSIFAADRQHIHHQLLDMGLTHRRAVLTLYVVCVAFTGVSLVAYFARSLQLGIALIALVGTLVAVVRFVGKVNASLLAGGRTVGDDLADRLRRSVPQFMRRTLTRSSVRDLSALLSEFALESGLIAVSIVNPQADRQRWRWEAPTAEGRASSDAVCAKFELPLPSQTIELQFFMDNASGVVGPQTRILLQLVADAAQDMLAADADDASDGSGAHGFALPQVM